MPHRVVIVGGGFAGLNAAKGLANAPVEVVLIDRRNFHLFQPLLYQVATAGLSPGDIAYPLRLALRKQKNARVLVGEMTGIDIDNQRVLLENGEVGYDTLIVATGATHSYFGHEEWAGVAPGLKTIEDATEIRSRIFAPFEAAEREQNARNRIPWLTFIVVGAGPTGVELAGTLGEITRDTLRGDFRSFSPSEARILLVDGTDRVLPTFPADLSRKAEQHLIGLGVRVLPKQRAIGVDADGVFIQGQDGGIEHLAAKTVLWAAGVKASPPGAIVAKATGAQTDRSGRVTVEPDLTVAHHPEILVLGDVASVNGGRVPGVAPAAIQMGQYAAKLIRARLSGRASSMKPFAYWNKGTLATIGRAAAVADFGKVRFGGFLAWLSWLVIHIFFLIGYQNRIVVVLKWAMQYFTYNRGARLITGEVADMPRVGNRGADRATGAETKR